MRSFMNLKFKKAVVILLTVSTLALTVSCQNGKQKTSQQDSSGVTTIKVFANLTVNESGKAWLDKIEQEKKIKLQLETPPDSNYKERLQIMLVSGQYPDLVLFKNNNDTEFINAVSSGVIVPVNKYLEKAPNLVKYSYSTDFDALKIKKDDNIYGIPRSTVLRGDGYIIRKDWLDKVGLSVKENGSVTQSEFEEILRRFTKNDPDGNGKNDTYGICSYATAETGMQMPVLQPFELFGWQKNQEGSYQYMDPRYSKSSNVYKKALEYNAKLFKEGLINPDSPVFTTDTVAFEKFKQGVVGVTARFPAHIFTAEKEAKKVNPNAKLIYISGIKNDAGEVKIGSSPLGTAGVGYWNFWSITKSNKNPEKTVEFLDWLISDGIWDSLTMYGLENLSYTVENGKKVPTGKNININKEFVRRNNDPDFFMSAVEEKFKPQTRENIQNAINNFVISKDRGYEPKISQSTQYIDYNKKMAEEITKILIGELPVSEYDKLLDGWYAAGGEEYIKDMNDRILQFEKK